jgi:hypothetical protein
MRYVITKSVINFSRVIEISEQDFLIIKAARSRLAEYLYIEEKFDLVVENYLEFETELLTSSVRHMLPRDQDYKWFQNHRTRLNRRIVNLLTACKFYLDQSTHHLHNMYGDDSLNVEQVLRERSAQYDAHLGYRAGDAIRNYTQHRGYPIHGLTFRMQRVNATPISNVRFTLVPYIDLSELEEDSKFKKSVLNDLRALGDTIDIRPLIREYVEGLGIIQEKVREILGSDISIWEGTIKNVIARFAKRFGKREPILGLEAVMVADDGSKIYSISIFLDSIEYRRGLEIKNRQFGSLARRYVSNEIMDADT